MQHENKDQRQQNSMILKMAMTSPPQRCIHSKRHTLSLVLRTKQSLPSCLSLISRHQEASVTPGKIVSSPLESIVLVKLLAQSAIWLCVVTDNVEEAVGICEHGLQVVAKVGITRSDPPQFGSSGRVDSVEEGAIDVSDVEFTFVDEVRDGGVENLRRA